MCRIEMCLTIQKSVHHYLCAHSVHIVSDAVAVCKNTKQEMTRYEIAIAKNWL